MWDQSHCPWGGRRLTGDREVCRRKKNTGTVWELISPGAAPGASKLSFLGGGRAGSGCWGHGGAWAAGLSLENTCAPPAPSPSLILLLLTAVGQGRPGRRAQTQRRETSLSRCVRAGSPEEVCCPGPGGLRGGQRPGTRGSMSARGRRGPQRPEGREARLPLRMGPDTGAVRSTGRGRRCGQRGQPGASWSSPAARTQLATG